MIDERERMMSHRSRSIDSHHERSRPSSNDSVPVRVSHPNDEDDDDGVDDFDESDSSVTRILKRRMRKKKKQINRVPSKHEEEENLHFDNLRRRLSSATMTSGDEEDALACSYKTVIHRPAAVPAARLPPPIHHPPLGTRFYPTSNGQPRLSQSMALPPSPIISTSYVVLPSVPVNLAMHHRAHTDTDLLFYNHPQPIVYPQHHHQQHWFQTPTPLMYPNQTAPQNHLLYAPPFIIQPTGPPLVRSSSADCRRTASHSNEHRIVHPERVW